ncbi:hypothetical protein [Candidatus Lokiarchaeum ossiferum]|uniref:hypothetical protein n=1 Tax=Candidatus Lokiarchaeum ossiferum TaxID=2951803 RepID=UPI00352C7902
MKRYSSIDFLRGVSMLIMLILHSIMLILNRPYYLEEISHIKSINLIVYLLILFYSGLAGLFLLVSSVGNMISMQKFLQKGKSTTELAKRQIIGGLILLLFAMLSEAILNHRAFTGVILREIDRFGEYAATTEGLWGTLWSFSSDEILSRYYHMETIHTIAWCVILNGITHAILSKKFKGNIKKMIKAYWILAIIIIALTGFVWWGVDQLIPGYPYNDLQYANLANFNLWEIFYKFWLLPLAGEPEPVFPYLAVSYIGSVVGIYMAQEDRSKIKTRFFKNLMYLGAVMFVVGLLGFLTNVVLFFIDGNFDAGMEVLANSSRHRDYTTYNERFDGLSLMIPGGWLFQFLCLNGFALACICMIIRLVDFRGKAEKFAKKTKFIRRLGTVAFTVYTIEWIIYLLGMLVYSLAPETFGGNRYDEMFWGGTLITLFLVLIVYWVLLWLWEKISYVGSIEWCIGELVALFSSSRRRSIQDSYETSGKKAKWYDYGKINVDTDNVEWINIVENEEIDHSQLTDSRFFNKLAVVSVAFIPFALICLFSASKTIKLEGKNKYIKRSILVSSINLGIALIVITILSIFTGEQLGIPL